MPGGLQLGHLKCERCEMKPRKLPRKVEEIVTEEVSKDFRKYFGDDFSVGPILVKTDYQPFREPHPEQSPYIAVSVVYEGDLSKAPLLWRGDVSIRVQGRLYEEDIRVYAFIDYVTKAKWQSGEWQPPRSWEDW